MHSIDREVSVRVRGRPGQGLPSSSCFSSLSDASGFFEPGSVGYSVTRETGPDEARFPRGSVELDCALLMRNLEHEWHGAEDLYV